MYLTLDLSPGNAMTGAASAIDLTRRVRTIKKLPMRLNIACWATTFRLAVLPVVILTIGLQWPHGYLIATVFCAMAGLSDGLDGYLARKYGCVTAFGKSFDLWADKVFVMVVMLALVLQNVIPYWMLVIVVLRELGVSYLRNQPTRLPISPDRWGKSKTGITLVALTGLLLHQEFLQSSLLAGPNLTSPLMQVLGLAFWLMLLAVALTVFSGANYFFKYLRVRGAGD